MPRNQGEPVQGTAGGAVMGGGRTGKVCGCEW